MKQYEFDNMKLWAWAMERKIEAENIEKKLMGKKPGVFRTWREAIKTLTKWAIAAILGMVIWLSILWLVFIR